MNKLFFIFEMKKYLRNNILSILSRFFGGKFFQKILRGGIFFGGYYYYFLAELGLSYTVIDICMYLLVSTFVLV